MSWFNESKRHSDARKGIKTASPKASGSGRNVNAEVMQYKLSQNIHRNITALDRKIRKATKLKSSKDIIRNLEDAMKLYNALQKKMENHKAQYNAFPDWIQHDWINNERFGDDGKVYKQMEKLKNAQPDDVKKEQDKLFNMVKFSTEQGR